MPLLFGGPKRSKKTNASFFIKRIAPARAVKTHEAYFPAEQSCSQAPPRFPGPHGHQERPHHSGPPPCEGPQPAFGVIAGAVPDTPALPLRRLKKRAQFLKAARGTKVARRGFVLQAVRVGEDSPGVGFTVTNKTGNAPARNRIRRRLRAAVAKTGGQLAAGHDYVLIGRREALNEPFAALVEDLSASIRRIHKVERPDKPRKGRAGVEVEP